MSSLLQPPCRSRKGNQGSAGVLVAVLLPAVLGVAGLAIDAGNLYVSHNKLQAAVDAGALVGSLQLPYDPDMNAGLVETAAADMVHENYPDATIASIDPGTEVRSVCVNGAATVDTLVLDVLGVASSTITASACAGFNDLEIVLVIDNSGSMKGTPISRVKDASLDLVELIMPEGMHSSSKIGLVGFRGKVRIGSESGMAPGCYNADNTPNPVDSLHPDYMDDYWALSSYYRRKISFDTCSSLPETQPLSNSTQRDGLISAVNAMDAQGTWSGTIISEGVRWGREVLTPEPPYDQGTDDEKIRKIMILLTDGDTEDGTCGGSYRSYYNPNNYWTNAWFGMGVTDCNCQDGGCLNQAVLDEAQTAKNKGIEIFTIRFGSSDGVDRQIMRDAASSKPGTDDHYFDAPSVEDIDDIFKQIGRQLGWRLLT